MKLYTIHVAACFAVMVKACDVHNNHVNHPHLGRHQHTRRVTQEVLDWEYSNSFDWHTIKPEYATCQTGTTQSPINLLSQEGVAVTHTPDLSGYSAQPSVSGNLFNWNFGPAFTLKHEGEDFSTLPSLKFDDQTLFLVGWHMHFPSEHLVDGVRSQAEMHMVHVDATGSAKSVIGIRIDASADPTVKSAFVESLPSNLISFNDTAQVEGVTMNPMAPIEEIGGLKEYWTYQGSLTTPPCTEGLRWFVSKQSLKVSQEQMVKLLGVSRFSHRVEQQVWNQRINV